jgi:hypothetical protein
MLTSLIVSQCVTVGKRSTIKHRYICKVFGFSKGLDHARKIDGMEYLKCPDW